MEVDAAESEVMDDTDGRGLRKAGFSLKRIVLRRKLEAPLDLRELAAFTFESAFAGSPESSSSPGPCACRDSE